MDELTMILNGKSDEVFMSKWQEEYNITGT